MSTEKEFLELYDSAHDRLAKFCHALTGDLDDAKDLIHETVLRALEGFHSIKSKEAFPAFLMGIARRIYLNQVRRNKFWKPFSESKALLIEDESNKADLAIEVRLLYEALAELPAKQKEAIILFEITGFSLKEISEIQKSGLSAVKARIVRGRKKLKQLLKESEFKKIKKTSYEKQMATHR